MSLQVTNQKTAVASRGQSVVVTLNGTETLSKLPQLVIGYPVTMGSSSNAGLIDSIDTLGHSFTVSPNNPDQYFESVEVGYLSTAELLTVTF